LVREKVRSPRHRQSVHLNKGGKGEKWERKRRKGSGEPSERRTNARKRWSVKKKF